MAGGRERPLPAPLRARTRTRARAGHYRASRALRSRPRCSIRAKNEIETSRSLGSPESAGGSARGRVVLPPPLPGP